LVSVYLYFETVKDSTPEKLYNDSLCHFMPFSDSLEGWWRTFDFNLICQIVKFMWSQREVGYCQVYVVTRLSVSCWLFASWLKEYISVINVFKAEQLNNAC